jgi:hypothetical protein
MTIFHPFLDERLELPCRVRLFSNCTKAELR